MMSTMLDDQTLVQAIISSPLSLDDKEHWRKLLGKLTPDQRKRLHHSLLAKTEIARAVNLIERALAIIAEAEADAEQEVQNEEEKKRERQALMRELEEIKDKEEEILMDEESLRKKHEETQAQIAAIREELRKLSIEAHGEPPPSYNQTVPEKT